MKKTTFSKPLFCSLAINQTVMGFPPQQQQQVQPLSVKSTPMQVKSVAATPQIRNNFTPRAQQENQKPLQVQQQVNNADNDKMIYALKQQVASLMLSLNNVERERDFYFNSCGTLNSCANKMKKCHL